MPFINSKETRCFQRKPFGKHWSCHLICRSLRFNLPATYDAHYLALAEWMEIDLWTADARLVNALKPFKVKWVKGIE